MPRNDLKRAQVEELYPWIEAETGMDFSGDRSKRLTEAVDKVLAKIVGSKNTADLSQGRLQQRGPLLERVTAELTIGESFFFRNEHHFQALREHVIPEILADNADKREVRLWSAGCAGGEEPYSLAILLDQILSAPAPKAGFAHDNPGSQWHISILGTDLNPEFLERARAAIFRPWSFRQTKVHENRTYFTQESDSYRLTPLVRDWVRFAYLNLVKDVYPSPLTGTLGLDLILFRNVAIYLKPDVTRAIVERLYRVPPGGWLLLGESEVGSVMTGAFEVRRFEQATFHQKPKAEPRYVVDASLPARPVLADIADGSLNLNAPAHNDGLNELPLVRGHAAPSLPDWVPLPLPKPKMSVLSERGGLSAGDRVMLKGSASQSVERLIAERRFVEAEEMIDRVANRRDRAQMRMKLIQAWLACAEVTRARKMLDRTLVEEPMLIEAQLLQACLAEESGHWDIAEQLYRRALYIDRNCPLAHFHLAHVQQQRGRKDVAQRSLKTTLKLIEKHDPHALVEHGEGVCYGRLKEMTMAILDNEG